ncbi:MAG: glycosyltransferase [Candidatus Sulfopaludibacter sp.]|nr:glycosyltransferase [Candidatus Sulfopaludibacter sp.]
MDPIYGDDFYHTIRDGSLRSASIVVPLVTSLTRPASVVDVGCGTGAWLSCFRHCGIDDIFGLEFSEVSPHLAHLGASHIRTVDASQSFDLPRTFDLAVSLEVAEHLPAESASGFVQSLVRLAPVVLFSAAVPGQGGVNHLNEQWPTYWAELFARHGYIAVDCLRDRIWTDRRIEWWYRQNLLLFVRGDLAPQYLEQQSPAALDRMMPYALRPEQPQPALIGDRPSVPAIDAVVLTKNGARRIARCLDSIVSRNAADNLVVCVDRETTDQTAEIARRFTDRVHCIQTGGNIESAFPQMASFCKADYILVIDDDEALGGNWDRRPLEALMRLNQFTALSVPRRWLVPPGDMFIANQPWFPDYKLCLFRNDPDLIRWPALIHDRVAVRGRNMVLFDRWIDHLDLIQKSRPDRERKTAYYRSQRPDHHCSEFYLYEEQDVEFLPADEAGFLTAVERFLAASQSQGPGQSVEPYRPGSEIRFDTGGNSANYTHSGWSLAESSGTWTDGPTAQLRIPLAQPLDGPAWLTLEAGAYLNPAHRSLRVQLSCEPDPLGEWLVETPEAIERSLPIPHFGTARQSLTLTFQLDRPASPSSHGESGDQRLLGLRVKRLRIDPQ